MAENVPTNGFVAPPAPGTQEPGFVQNPGAPVVPEVPAAASSAPETKPDSELAAAIAALTKAIGNKPAESSAEPNAEVKTPVAPTSGLNELDPKTIDDPILRSMATVMHTVGKGLDMDRVFSKALEHGDASLLDTAYLREKGGDNAEQLVAIAEGIVQAVEARAEQTTQEVYKLVGGEQQWNAGMAAFNKGAPQALRVVVGQMLDSGKHSQIMAGAQLIAEYAKQSGLVPNVNPLINQGGAGVPAGQALSKEGFITELRKLDPNSRTYQQARGDLFARRQMGKQLGM